MVIIYLFVKEYPVLDASFLEDTNHSIFGGLENDMGNTTLVKLVKDTLKIQYQTHLEPTIPNSETLALTILNVNGWCYSNSNI